MARRRQRKVGSRDESRVMADLSSSVASLGNRNREEVTSLDNDDVKSAVTDVSIEEKKDEDFEGEDDAEQPATDGYSTAAVALCVNAGSFDDPPELPGLAHFVEHMVFMGSKKYPGENEFDQFIQKAGGDANAYTEGETTCFYFHTQRRHLREGEKSSMSYLVAGCFNFLTLVISGMDRFAQFFVSPLLRKEAMTREREAIDSEFKLVINNDECRKQQVIEGELIILAVYVSAQKAFFR